MFVLWINSSWSEKGEKEYKDALVLIFVLNSMLLDGFCNQLVVSTS